MVLFSRSHQKISISRCEKEARYAVVQNFTAKTSHRVLEPRWCKTYHIYSIASNTFLLAILGNNYYQSQLNGLLLLHFCNCETLL